MSAPTIANPLDAVDLTTQQTIPDQIIDEPQALALVGYTFQYTYTTGVHYRISFSEKEAFFRVPVKVQGRNYINLPYRIRELRENQYLVHWLIPGRAGAVTLIFDMDKKVVDCASLMPGGFQLWDRAQLTGWKTDGKGALWHRDPTEEIEEW